MSVQSVRIPSRKWLNRHHPPCDTKYHTILKLYPGTRGWIQFTYLDLKTSSQVPMFLAIMTDPFQKIWSKTIFRPKPSRRIHSLFRLAPDPLPMRADAESQNQFQSPVASAPARVFRFASTWCFQNSFTSLTATSSSRLPRNVSVTLLCSLNDRAAG